MEYLRQITSNVLSRWTHVEIGRDQDGNNEAEPIVVETRLTTPERLKSK